MAHQSVPRHLPVWLLFFLLSLLVSFLSGVSWSQADVPDSHRLCPQMNLMRHGVAMQIHCRAVDLSYRLFLRDFLGFKFKETIYVHRAGCFEADRMMQLAERTREQLRKWLFGWQA